MEEIQKLLQEFESLEQEGVEYTIEKDLTLDEIKFLIYMRKNKIDCDELRKKLSNKFQIKNRIENSFSYINMDS